MKAARSEPDRGVGLVPSSRTERGRPRPRVLGDRGRNSRTRASALRSSRFLNRRRGSPPLSDLPHSVLTPPRAITLEPFLRPTQRTVLPGFFHGRRALL